MAIKILADAGFNAENHWLAFTHKDGKITASVFTADPEREGEFIEFTGKLPVSRALDTIRCLHNGEVISGQTLGRTLPKTEEVQEALIRQYRVTNPSYQARLGLIEYAPKS
jgi:hypothetical protein